MRILVAGSAGFIGSAAAKHFVCERGATVLGIDLAPSAFGLGQLQSVSTSPRFRYRRADVADAGRILALIDDFAPDWVVNATSPTRAATGGAPAIDAGLSATCRLLEAVREHWTGLSGCRREAFRFLNVSSVEVFGGLKHDGAFRETSAWKPETPLAAAKAAADHIVLGWHRSYGLPTMLSHGALSYGAYQKPDAMLASIVLAALEGRALTLPGSGEETRDWIHVDDHVAALWRILESGTAGESYNISARAERSDKAVVDRIVQLLDRHAPQTIGGVVRRGLVSFSGQPAAEPARQAIDPAKLERTTGWRAQESLESGLARTVKWYIANEAWWRPLLDARRMNELLGLTRAA